jgi:predicted HicB family RNase H-like nuclease
MARVNIEVPDELHKKSKVACAIKGITLIEFINQAIDEKLKRKEEK